MATKIFIPTPLRQYAGNQKAVNVNGETVGELLNNLTTEFSALRKHLYNEEGQLRSFVNIYVNDEDFRYLQGPATNVQENDEISIIPSIAGGKEA